MKNSALLIVALFLMFSKTGWGDENPYFKAYVDSSAGVPDNSTTASAGNNINPPHTVDNETGKHPQETDAKPALQGIPSKWQVCAVDSDCTAGTVDCVTWEALNKKFLNKLAGNLRSCSASVDPGFQPEAVCADKTCKTTEKTTGVSWEEWYNGMRKERTNL